MRFIADAEGKKFRVRFGYQGEKTYTSTFDTMEEAKLFPVQGLIQQYFSELAEWKNIGVTNMTTPENNGENNKDKWKSVGELVNESLV